MSDGIWMSRALIDDDLRCYNLATDVSLTATRKDGEELAREGWSITETLRANLRGVPLPADRFPARVLGPDDGDYGFLPDLFSIGGYWLVTPEAADVLRGFDLGAGNLHPVRMMDSNFKRALLPDRFCLNFGAVKDTVLLDASDSLEPAGGAGLLRPLARAGDGDIAVTAEALSGPDLWIEARLADAFFVSDALAEALRAAGVGKVFGLRQCRVMGLAGMKAPGRPGEPAATEA